MRTMTLVAIATALAAAPALGQSSAAGNAAMTPAAGPVAAAPPAAAKTLIASTPESRSAAALALSHEPTLDEGTAQRLKEAVLSYSKLAARGGWPTIPADAKFTSGTAGPNDELLRKRLVASGDLAPDKASGPFDADVMEGVKRFQARQGLAPTGLVTPRTLAALNVPVQKRLQQLQASLSRVQNINFSFGPRYVVVNLPAAFAEAVENDKVVRRYRVVVGKTETPSPTLTAAISSVHLNPTWTVPSSVTKTEISAHMRNDPGYLARMHMDLIDAHDAPIDPKSVDWSGTRTPNFIVRQQSGTWNALGAVKIDMPNPYAVYMHDSNQHNLFGEEYRFASHGCSRVDNVRDFAAWLLQAELPKWDRAAIDTAIATGQREEIALPKKVPVAWVYLTAWVTRDHTVQFRNDVYNQDAQLLEASTEEAAFFNQAGNRPSTAPPAR